MNKLLIMGTLLAAASSTLLGQPVAAPAMAGPRIATAETTRTLVVHDLDGNVRRPELSAEQTAASLLDLTPHQRAAVDEVFDRRALALERFIENNLDLVMRLGGFDKAEPKERWWLADQTFRRTAFLRVDGPLQSQVRAALPPAQAAVYDRLLKDYWKAIGTEGTRGPNPKGYLGAVLEEKFKSLGREAEAAYHRCEKSGGLLYHYLFDTMTMGEDQEKQLRRLCATYAAGGLDNRDKKEEGMLIVSVMQVLTPEQRVVLGKRLNPQGITKRKAKR